MELAVKVVSEEVPGYTLYNGQEKFNISAGKHLKIETSPEGNEILDAIVPTGKKWLVSILVSVQEENA